MQVLGLIVSSAGCMMIDEFSCVFVFVFTRVVCSMGFSA